MKKTIFVLLLLVFFVSCSGKGPEKTVLSFTSWRTEDIERMERILSVFNSKHSDLEVKFTPIKDTEYDAQLRTSLASGVGADIIFLRSFTSVDMYKSGYLLDLNDVIPGIENFPTAAKSAWSWEKYVYGIPFVGVTHGVYYNKDIFTKYGLNPPQTWNEFINIAKKLKESGELVFAQGTVDAWTLYEVVFSGLGLISMVEKNPGKSL
ncbi:extracellular solute-binding protein [Spirochaetia bacterium 38H-sp]|uniref:Extracellular solute-binding protein n=1 Tax=Rarispira pelagica TaxID=3141764 RepID=A0ABU9UAB8_9SPIR